VIVHRDAPAVVLMNQTEGGHWLGLKLTGTRSGKTPVGARIVSRWSGSQMVRWLTAGTGYLAAHDQRVWFGLGQGSRVARLEVRWPSGQVQTWNDVVADRIVEVEEGRPDLRVAANKKKGDSGDEPGIARIGTEPEGGQ
jgi:hypothetical protein